MPNTVAIAVHNFMILLAFTVVGGMRLFTHSRSVTPALFSFSALVQITHIPDLKHGHKLFVRPVSPLKDFPALVVRSGLRPTNSIATRPNRILPGGGRTCRILPLCWQR
tara:strand:+ start:437 stop:763 length:327 start_codon:yes stop_codon:yes gene_type:complete